MMQARHSYNGTPAEFNYDAHEIARRIRATVPHPLMHSTALPDDAYVFSFVAGENTVAITAQRDPDGRTSLTADATDEAWALLGKWWEQMRGDMERRGLIEAAPDPLTAKEIIQKYYMRRGKDKKLTLRQHLQEIKTDLSEGYIRKVKWAYDKQHKAKKERKKKGKAG